MIGERISHYRILELIGEGGMGVVYKAEDTKLGRTVALKFLKPQSLGSDEEKTRFFQEAQAAAVLDHPNICTVFEIDEQNGETYIAMAYCDGQSLKQKIKSGPLAPLQALEIALQVAAGLQEAHEKGIVHRDIKSGNIMLTARGQAKIMDFGIAKLIERTQITGDGKVMGTAAYMSPEQAKGEAVDVRTDIWSLGVVLFEMITGKMPFRGDTEVAVLHSLLYEPPKPVKSACPACPESIEEIIKRCLEKSPADRYQSARELKNALRAVMIRQGVASEVTETKTLVTRAAFRMRRLLWPSVAGIAAIAVLILLLIPESRQKIKSWIGTAKVPDQKHLLILPFRNVGGDLANQRFCDGLVEILSSRLSQLEKFQGALWVVPTTEVRSSQVASPSEARRAFSVNLVITGSFLRQEENIVFTMNLIDAVNLRQLRSEIFTDSLSNIALFQDGIVLKMAEMLEVELRPEMRQELTAGGTAAPAAYECYLQGVGYLERYEKEENLDAAVGLFQKAISLDPSYALAYAGLGESLWKKYELTKDPALVGQAEEACRRAVGINENLAAVHIALGIVYRGKGQYDEAIRQFEEALSRDPTNFEANLGLAKVYEDNGNAEKAEEVYKRAISLTPSRWAGYSYLGSFYSKYARFREAEKMFRKVVELTPDNYRGYSNLMGIYYYLNENSRIEEMFEKSIAIKPTPNAYSNMGTIRFFQGRYDDALKKFEEAIRLGQNEPVIWGNLGDCYRYTPGYEGKAKEAYQRAIKLAEEAKRVNPRDAQLRSRLALYRVLAGETKKALDEITEARELASQDVWVLRKCVQVYEFAGRRDMAFNALQDYLTHGGGLGLIEGDPDMKELCKDRRFAGLKDKAK